MLLCGKHRPALSNDAMIQHPMPIAKLLMTEHPALVPALSVGKVSVDPMKK
jgi:hypothetical protein